LGELDGPALRGRRQGRRDGHRDGHEVDAHAVVLMEAAGSKTSSSVGAMFMSPQTIASAASALSWSRSAASQVSL